MFDTVLGLPVHPLIVHAVVILGPLAALCLVAYAAVPRWRVGLRWPTVALALIAAGSAFVATEAGEAFEQRVGTPGFDHAARGDLAFYALLTLLAATVLVIFVLARVGSTQGVLAGLLVAVLAAGFALTAVTLAGHTGAKAVWSNRIAATG